MSPGSAPSMVVFLTLYFSRGQGGGVGPHSTIEEPVPEHRYFMLRNLFGRVTVFASAFRLRGGEETSMMRAASRVAGRGACLSLLVIGLVRLATADTITISGVIAQSTSDGTGPAANNPSLNNI